ncbi:MAG: VCBS repeat-containing protein [Pseudomonadota bacterium]
MRSALVLGFIGISAPALSADISAARYEDPTTRYAHGVLGDAIEHGTLVMQAGDETFRIVLPDHRVFEDTEPRLFDVDGDGDREVITVESDANLGARLAIYDSDGLVAANDFIGRRNRWLAPAGGGAADLDGDGAVELVFVDRPHLAKTLRVYEFRDGALTLEGSLEGVTNHRIGERDIAGGIRVCDPQPEIIVADASWQLVLSVRWNGDGFDVTDLGPHLGRSSFADAMSCQ